MKGCNCRFDVIFFPLTLCGSIVYDVRYACFLDDTPILTSLQINRQPRPVHSYEKCSYKGDYAWTLHSPGTDW
jgi:hypothetical protein